MAFLLEQANQFLSVCPNVPALTVSTLSANLTTQRFHGKVSSSLSLSASTFLKRSRPIGLSDLQYLSYRQYQILKHKVVPQALKGVVSQQDYDKSQAYSRAKVRFLVDVSADFSSPNSVSCPAFGVK
jgi:CAAX prenyl protease N-terminal, five membrane helices